MSQSMHENLLNKHYESLIKLDYFILGIDVALLGWTVVNTNWIPEQSAFVWFMLAFWFFIVFSIICGIVRQLCISGAFGANAQAIYSAEIASSVERAVLEGGAFTNQQTGETISANEFANYGKKQRGIQKNKNSLWDKLSKKSYYFGNAAILFLVVALCLLAIIKIISLV